LCVLVLEMTGGGWKNNAAFSLWVSPRFLKNVFEAKKNSPRYMVHK
jgi:hypothetical protein